VVFWTVFYGWACSVALSEFVEFISPVAVGVGAGFFALYSNQIKRHAPVLNVLPISQRTVARGFWWIFVVAVPSSIFLLEGAVLMFRGEGPAIHGMLPEFFERWMAAFGMTASWSILFGLGSRLSVGKAPLRLHVAALAVLLIACGLSTTWVPRIAEQPLEGNLVLAVSILMVSYSYRRAEDAWGPRKFVVQHQRDRQNVESFHGVMNAGKRPGPAGLLSVYHRPALVGAACGVGIFAVASAVISMDRDGLNRNEFADGAPLAISLICFGVVVASPYWLPNMRSLRLLPLSRARLTGYVLAYALTAFLGAPILVIVGSLVLGWNPIATIALLCAAAGWYLCAVVLVIRSGSDPMNFPLLFGTIVLPVFAYDRSVPALIAFGLATAALAYVWLYALLGSGKAVYHRANALNRFSPYEV
jgi:hypothetical protein